MNAAGFIAVAIASLLAVARMDGANVGHTKGRAVEPFTPILKAGDYSWHPGFSPAGPVVVFVSLPEQMLYVYRNGVQALSRNWRHNTLNSNKLYKLRLNFPAHWVL